MERSIVRSAVLVATVALAGAGAAIVANHSESADATPPPISWHVVDEHSPSPDTSEPDLYEGIATFDTGGATYPPSFGTDGEGDVRLRGVVQATGAPLIDLGGPYGVLLFTLPCGLVPSDNLIFPTSAMVGGFAPGVIQIADNGDVALLVDGSSVDLAEEEFSGITSLDGIRYEPEDVACP